MVGECEAVQALVERVGVIESTDAPRAVGGQPVRVARVLERRAKRLGAGRGLGYLLKS